MFRFKVDQDLELRLLDERCTEELFTLTDQNRHFLRPWLPWVDWTTTPADTRSFIQSGLHQFTNNNGMQAGIWLRGELAGTIGFHYWNWPHRKTEIGYWLGEAYQGQGAMTRACRAMVDYAFGELRLNRVEIRCATGNVRSRAIPERLGFTSEGILRQVEWLDDHFVNHVVYGMLASEWSSAPH